MDSRANLGSILAALPCFIATLLAPAPVRSATPRPLPTAQPADVQLDAARLNEAVARVREAVERNDLRGAVLLVARRGRIVLHEPLGFADSVERRPMQRDTVFHVASNTKPVVAAAALQLAADSRLDLDVEIGRYLPKFDREAYRGVTLRRLLSHTSGLRIGPIFLNPLSPRSDALPNGPTLRSETARFAEINVAVKPGTSYAYNNAGYNLAGAVLEQAADMPLDQLLAERLYKPLAMHSTAHVDQERLSPRRAAIERRSGGQWTRAWKPGDPPQYPFVRASGGMLTTAADYASFLQMFLDRGQVGEQVVLPYPALRQAVRAETRELAVRSSNSAANSPAAQPTSPYYGLGWQVADDGVCAHSGSDGTYAWFDPRRELLGVFFTQSPGGVLPFKEFREQIAAACTNSPTIRSRVVAHRGLLREYPENTLVNFRECLERGYGFEFDVRRTRDGELVCMHDENLARTTGHPALVADLTLAEIKQLDAGGWFAPQFQNERVPTVEQVFQLLGRFPSPRPPIAVDLKQDDPRVEADVVALAVKHGVLERLVMIGRAIDHPEVRERLWNAHEQAACACLAQTPDDLDAVLADARSTWAYLRFIPTRQQMDQLRKAGKRVFVAGSLFAAQQPENWRLAVEQGVNAILTDYADELQQQEP